MSEHAWQRSEHDCNGDAAAYVLGALDDHEVAPFLRYLESCAICRDEVGSLQVVADMLPASVTPITAPRGLRRRVLATVYEEAELFAAAGARETAKRATRRDRRPVPRLFQGLAAAALVAAGIAVGTVALGGTSTSTPKDRVILANTTAPTTALLRVSAGRTELDVANLAAPANGRVYEVWLQRNGEPQATDALFTPTTDGRAAVAVPGDLGGVGAVMVTEEPAGGSTKPTRAPLLVASLQ
ncbi:MAG: anti-sigma factor domain-containing protein [Solirubrobacteraceae bacterium]